MAEVRAIKNIRMEETKSGMGLVFRAVADIWGGEYDGQTLLLDSWSPAFDGPMPKDWFRLKEERARCLYKVIE